MSRVVEVAPERLERWLAGFAERHDGIASATPEHVVGGDGAEAVFDRFAPEPMGVVLVRRGGYACALVSGGSVVASKVGTRHVQSRTAAGGWSQQRFARRRGNQADALVEAVAGHALRILLAGNESPATGARGIPAGLVVGGDRALVAQVLEDSGLRALSGLPRRELYDLPDPRRDVLDTAVQRGRAVRVTLTEPAA
ncbi:MAG: acVLRF1 family peptidyl-tRNA hydrolase [Lapillicoccus sp.]